MGNRNQKFGSSSTAEQTAEGADLTGKVVIITGANAGIGKETARVLALHGGTIILACRDSKRGQEAKDEIIKSVSSSTPSSDEKKDTSTNINERIELMELDLGSLQSVRDFAHQFVKKHNQLHYLVNNAGIMANAQYTLSKDGLETQFATNHLGHYYLTRLLLPTMLKTPGKSRLVQVASGAHNRAPNPFSTVINDLVKRKDGPAKEGYDGWRNYGISKACNVLHARQVNSFYSKQENGVYGVSLHPGVIVTDLWKNVPGGVQWIVKNLGKAFIKNVPQGAATTVRCVCMSDDELKEGGQYYVDCNPHDDKLRVDLRQSNPPADPSIDSLLWNLSEELIVAKGFSLTLEEEESKQNDSVDTKQSEAEQKQENQSETEQNKEKSEATNAVNAPDSSEKLQTSPEQQSNETTTDTGADTKPSDAQN